MWRRVLILGVTVGITMILTTIFQPLAFLQTYAQDQSCQTFRETGKTVCGRFLRYWQQDGGLRIFGYPITNPFQEQSVLDNEIYTVQYFERAEFESHPQNQAPYDVELAQLGTFRFHTHYAKGDPSNGYSDNLPRYPGAQNLTGVYYPDETYLSSAITYTTKAPPAEILAFYRDVLPKNGFERDSPVEGSEPNTYTFFFDLGLPPGPPGGFRDSPGPYIEVVIEAVSPSETRVIVRHYNSD